MVLPRSKDKKKGHEKRKSDAANSKQKISLKKADQRRGTVIPYRNHSVTDGPMDSNQQVNFSKMPTVMLKGKRSLQTGP